MTEDRIVQLSNRSVKVKHMTTENFVNTTVITDKGNGLVNEDSFLVTPKLFGVFDGASGLIKYTDAGGNTGGLLASQIARKVFETDPSIPFTSAIQEITNRINKSMGLAKIDFYDKAALWTTSASIVRISGQFLEYAQIGDSPIVFVKKDGTLQVQFVEHDLETLLLWRQLNKEGVNDIRHTIQMEEQLLKNRRQANISYGVLNGEQDCLRFVVQGNIPIAEVSHVLIFSDGMLIPKNDPEEAEKFETIIALYKEGGLTRIKDFIRQLESSDSNCKEYPRFRKNDDLTAIAINLK